MLADAVPVDVTVTVLAAFVPIVTLPKLKLVALAASDPTRGATPFPSRFTIVVGVAASVTIVTVPLAWPTTAGMNWTLIDNC
jgi:hypothetical protein